ncbi:zinc finger protein 501-like isoform X3 [Phycodurus eques]|uniref:zinc finger protein 501-like isoform X3 n=1 Tax=Phycodurus eques TaxID=693459 RepID=UPI002ACE5532|nr:zinc finger protein 501-like isoform X3 [Phycodurus eques]
MCKVEILRALLNQRLSAAVEEVFVVFARTIAEYEEELCRTKEENERQRQLLDAVFKPQVAFHHTDISEEELHPEHQGWSFSMEQQQREPPNIKEEEPLYIKEEKEQADIANVTVTDAIANIENDEDNAHWSQLHPSQSDENRGEKPPSGCSSQHATTKHDRDHRGGSQEDSLLAPLSDSNNTESHSPDTDDDKHSKGVRTCPADNTHFKCSQCDKSFINTATLKRHMMIHKGEKTFNCSFCGKRFNQKVHLIKHTRTHTGEKPFSCTVCGMRLSQKEYLKVHMRTHTGEKPFPCSVCGKKFSQKAFLKVHTRTHTGEKPFSCLVCNKSFSAYSTCTRHQRTHTGDKVFSCSVCDKKFTRKDNLNKHKCNAKK